MKKRSMQFPSKKENNQLIRRVLHLSMGLVPWLYYWHDMVVAHSLGLPKQAVVLIVLLIILLLDCVRLRTKITIIGQRHYENHRLSSAAWASLGITVVLLFTPEIGRHGAALGLPLIVSMALVDPLLGELRQRQKGNTVLGTLIGIMAAYLIWGVSYYYLYTPFWLVLIIPPMTVLAERPNFPRWDDDFLMLIVPWLVVMAYLLASALLSA
jgi:hypothetical protein